MAPRHFEVVVAGSTSSALLLASVFARRGIRAALVDQGELEGAELSLLGRFGLGEEGSAAMELVHAELGISHDLRRRSKPGDPNLQVVLPDQRFDLYADRARSKAEIARALGLDAAAQLTARLQEIDRWEASGGELLGQIGALPPRGFFARRRAIQAVKRRGELITPIDGGGMIDRILAQLLPFGANLDRTSVQASKLVYARIVARLLRGLLRFEGPGARAQILEAGTRSGLELIHGVIDRSESAGKLLKLGLAKRGETLTADALVDASSDLSAVAAFAAESRPRGLTEQLEEARPKGRLYALSLELDRAVIPPAMAELVLLLRGRRDLRDEEDGPILIYKRSVTAERVQLIALHPLAAAQDHSAGIAHLEEVMQQQIERLIPFAAEGNLVSRPAVERGVGHRGDVAHPLFDPALDPIAGIGGISTQTPIKNVFLAGPSVWPGLGLEGAYLATLEVSDRVDVALGRAKGPKYLERLAARAPAARIA